VLGSASAGILPSPSLTFTEVQVGDSEGRPMMTVDRFEVTIELMPLLQGEIHVVSMKLARPIVRVAVDDNVTVDWLLRSEASEALDPEKVILDNVEISDGVVVYSDARTGIDVSLDSINAVVVARALSGPWRVEGSYLDNGIQVPFRFATGRTLDDGTIRVRSDFSPAIWPVSVSADGAVGRSLTDGLSYTGTYSVTEVTTGPEEQQGASTGWRSEGSFTLTRDRLDIDKAVLSNGPEDRSSSMAGALSIDFGEEPHFNAQIQARQLDLDRTLGAGPTQPVEVAAAWV
jgi:hypothetical protein